MGNTPHNQVSQARLRQELKRLHITAETAGQPIKQLIVAALTTADPLGYVSTFAVAQPPDQNNAPSAISVRLREVTITLPLDLDGCPGYVPRHVEIGNMPELQGRTLACLREGLKRQGARLQDEKPIWHLSDVVRYMLEQVAAAVTDAEFATSPDP